MMDRLLFHSKAAILKRKDNPYGLPEDAGRILSNFGDIPVRWRGESYPTVEHAFQGAKYLFASNHPEFEKDFRTGGMIGPDPVDAKKAGGRDGMKKRMTVLDVPMWNAISDQIMKELISEKAKHPVVRDILIICQQNGIALYHYSRFDMKWGCHINPPRGENRLGGMYTHCD